MPNLIPLCPYQYSFPYKTPLSFPILHPLHNTRALHDPRSHHPRTRYNSRIIPHPTRRRRRRARVRRTGRTAARPRQLRRLRRTRLARDRRRQTGERRADVRDARRDGRRDARWDRRRDGQDGRGAGQLADLLGEGGGFWAC